MSTHGTPEMPRDGAEAATLAHPASVPQEDRSTQTLAPPTDAASRFSMNSIARISRPPSEPTLVCVTACTKAKSSLKTFASRVFR